MGILCHPEVHIETRFSGVKLFGRIGFRPIRFGRGRTVSCVVLRGGFLSRGKMKTRTPGGFLDRFTMIFLGYEHLSATGGHNESGIEKDSASRVAQGTCRTHGG